MTLMPMRRPRRRKSCGLTERRRVGAGLLDEAKIKSHSIFHLNG
jgi:hypothetical protein